MLEPLSRYRERRIYLDLSLVSAEEADSWMDVVERTVEQAGVPYTLHVEPSGATPDPHEPFVFICGSQVLSRKLIASFSRLFIRPQGPVRRSSAKRVSLISSVFSADRFLTRFLDNSTALDQYERFEHFLIRPNSPGAEHAALIRHVERNPETVVYINLKRDPGLYEVWNLGAQLSTAPYLSNANVDDQRAPEHTRTLAGYLDAHPDLDVVSTALRVTKDPDVPWTASHDCPVMFSTEGQWRYGLQDMLGGRREGFAIRDIPHCMPLWRRRLHVLYGYFNEGMFGASADAEFWLRAASRGAGFLLEGIPLGLYLKDDASYWSRAESGSYTDRVAATHAGTHDEPFIAGLVGEARQLRSRCAWLELIGRLRCLNAIPARSLTVSAAEMIRKTTDYYLGSGRTVLNWSAEDQTPAATFHSLVRSIIRAAQDLRPSELEPQRVFTGALSDPITFFGNTRQPLAEETRGIDASSD